MFRALCLGAMAAVAVAWLQTDTAAPLLAQGATAPAATVAYDPKDLSGMWLRTKGPYMNTAEWMEAARRVAPPGAVLREINPADWPNRHPPLPLEYTPEFQVHANRIMAEWEAGRPVRSARHCISGGIYQMMMSVPWIEIWTRDDRLMFKSFLVAEEYRVFMHRKHRAEYVNTPELFGDSVGRWEGNTLVIDTVNLGATPVLMEVEPISQSLGITQRISRPTAATLLVELTASDPRAWKRPAVFHAAFRKQGMGGTSNAASLDQDLDPVESQCFEDGGGAEIPLAPK